MKASTRKGRATPRPSVRRGRGGGGPETPPQIVVLAAGVGSRMRSTLPKVLHRIGGRTLLDAVLDTAEAVSPSRIVAVLGAGRDEVERSLAGRAVTIVIQEPPLGTCSPTPSTWKASSRDWRCQVERR